ncbi:MAG: WD40 repeat domain-containing protein, partial [Gemmataceae bacterium]
VHGPSGLVAITKRDEEKDKREVILVDIKTGKVRQTMTRIGQPIAALAFNASGTRLVFTQPHQSVALYDVAENRVISEENTSGEYFKSVEVHPNGEAFVMAAYNGRIYAGDFATAKDQHGQKVRRGTSAAYSPDGKHLIIGTHDGWIGKYGFGHANPEWEFYTGQKDVRNLAVDATRGLLWAVVGESHLHTWHLPTISSQLAASRPPR